MSWSPKHGFCVDYGKRLVSPVIPKSACTTLRKGVYLLGEPVSIQRAPRGEFTNPNHSNCVPDNFDCMIYYRDPIERFISGIAEIITRDYNNLHDAGLFYKPDEDQTEAEEFALNFMDDKSFQDLLDYFTTKNELNIHIYKQTIIIDWQNLQNKFQNITMIEVNEYLWPNTLKWMEERGTPLEGDYNNEHNRAFRLGHKSFIKGIFALAIRDNRNNLLDDCKEYYQTDIDFYNKAKFYRGAEQ